MVALRKESVDRNFTTLPVLRFLQVALRKESVDRNVWMRLIILDRQGVALRKESVDRNVSHGRGPQIFRASLSARRAWIEMSVMVAARRFSGRRSPQGERG